MKNISFGTRLGSAFASIVLLFVSGMVLGVWMLGNLDKHVRDVDERALPYTIVVEEMNLARSEVQQFLTDVSATHDREAYGEAEESAKRFREGVAKFRQRLQQEGNTGRLKQLDAIAASFETFYASGKKMAEAYINEGLEAGNLLMKGDDKIAGFDKDSENIGKALDEFREQELADARETSAQARATISLIITLEYFGGVVTVVLAVVLATLITRQVLRQLGGDPKDVAQIINTMAAGNFTLDISRKAVAGSLLADAHAMQTSLRTLISDMKKQSEQVGDMARSLAAAARQISENVNRETDAVSSMAAAIEEMSVSTSHISDQGSSARSIAENSLNSAEQGTEVVNKTVAGLLATAQEIETASSDVSRLGEDSSRISDVVKVIKEIADQTNLLALNAAIEAARAGEQGRGFAVVADEVRKLAERTASATSEINEMSGKIGEVAQRALGGMEDVVATTRQGVADAESAQSSIGNIRQSFEDVSRVIDEISSSLAEQKIASTELAKSTEHVAQMAEENASATRSLLEMAAEMENLAQLVKSRAEVFKV